MLINYLPACGRESQPAAWPKGPALSLLFAQWGIEGGGSHHWCGDAVVRGSGIVYVGCLLVLDSLFQGRQCDYRDGVGLPLGERLWCISQCAESTHFSSVFEVPSLLCCLPHPHSVCPP